MRPVFLSLVTLGLAVMPAAAHQGHHALQQSAPPAQVNALDLGHGIYMLQGRGGNIGLLTGPDGAFVIDSQYADMSPANLAEIQSLAGEAPRFLVNTHWHGDHTGGNEAFNAAGATIIAHDNVRRRVSTDQTRIFDGEARETKASAVEAWPVITFPEAMKLHLNGQTIRLIHFPGAHTDGDTAVYFEEANVLHMGDVMFSGMFPYIDRSSGGSLEGYLAALDTAYELADEETAVIPGHGEVSTRSDIKELSDMLRSVKDKIAPLVAQDMSLEAVLERAPLSDLADVWATSFMTEPRFTTIIYNDLVQARTTRE